MTRPVWLGWALAACVCGGIAAASSGDIVLPSFARHADAVPALALSGRVVDAAGIIERRAQGDLAKLSERLERDTKVQLVIATTLSLKGQTISAYSRTLANAWGVGDKARNDGLLLLVAPNERMVRIEVGTGLERSLPNARCREIVSLMLPAFRANDLSGAIVSGARSLDMAVRHPTTGRL